MRTEDRAAEAVSQTAKRLSVIRLHEWRSSATLLPEAEHGNARIRRVTYEAATYHCNGVQGYDFFELTAPAKVTTLQRRKNGRWMTWMVDDPPHFWSMQTYARNSKGRVLVAGLGLGMVARELAENPAVEAIHVVEIDPDVIALVGPHMPPKVGIIRADFHRYIEETREHYDRIIADLWVVSGIEQVNRVARDEVAPLALRLWRKWPEANAVFHGFGGSYRERFFELVREEANSPLFRRTVVSVGAGAPLHVKTDGGSALCGASVSGEERPANRDDEDALCAACAAALEKSVKGRPWKWKPKRRPAAEAVQ